MKSNLQYIFDKITSSQSGADPTWRTAARAPLLEQITEICLSDRGADIGAQAAGRVADAVMAARQADRDEVLRIRQSLAGSPQR